MKTEVLLERVADGQYRATGSGRFGLSVEGKTREEAIFNFQKAAMETLMPQTEVVEVEIPVNGTVDIPKNDPWAWFAGIMEDEPLYEEYLAEIERNRQIDEENERRKMAE